MDVRVTEFFVHKIGGIGKKTLHSRIIETICFEIKYSEKNLSFQVCEATEPEMTTTTPEASSR